MDNLISVSITGGIVSAVLFILVLLFIPQGNLPPIPPPSVNHTGTGPSNPTQIISVPPTTNTTGPSPGSGSAEYFYMVQPNISKTIPPPPNFPVITPVLPGSGSTTNVTRGSTGSNHTGGSGGGGAVVLPGGGGGGGSGGGRPPANSPPIAQNDFATTPEDTPVTIPVLANDHDPDGDGLGIASVGSPAHGTSKLNLKTNTVTYTPDSAFVGIDTFNYTIADGHANSATSLVTVTVVGTRPVSPIAMGQTITISENQRVNITMQAADADGNRLTFEIVTNSSHGVLMGLNSTSGAVVYSPAAWFHGNDSFKFRALDGSVESNTATVSIIVRDTSIPTAFNQSIAVAPGDGANIVLVATDADHDSLAYSIVSSPTRGSMTHHDGNVVTYSPFDNVSSGSDVFTFKANDGTSDSNIATVSIDISQPLFAHDQNVSTGENLPLTISLLVTGTGSESANNVTIVSMPVHGNLSAVLGRNVTYTPNENFHGSDSFVFKVGNGIVESNEATVYIRVNDTTIPIAQPLWVKMAENSTTSITLNASDADNDPLTYRLLLQPSHGNVSGFDRATGKLTYTPQPGFYGIDTFSFEASDGSHNGTGALVTILVKAPPKAHNQWLVVNENSTLHIVLNATDMNGYRLEYQIVSFPAHGNLTVLSRDTVRYVPEPGYFGLDNFTFVAKDRLGESDVATVHITVKR
ncbi:MAG: Ig-like domain-containing protein [Nitrososphaera sp.]